MIKRRCLWPRAPLPSFAIEPTTLQLHTITRTSAVLTMLPSDYSQHEMMRGTTIAPDLFLRV